MLLLNKCGQEVYADYQESHVVGAGVVVQHIKLPLGTLSSHIRMLVGVQATLIQFPQDRR